METVSVSCNSCGAPLKVGTQVRFLTCQFCNTQLEIKHSDSAIFTEQIGSIANNTAQMAHDLEAIKIQNEIGMLDREAAASSVQSPGARASTSPAGSIVGLAFAAFFALVCFSMAWLAGKSGAPGLFTLVPVGMGIFAIVAAVVGLAKSADQAATQENLRSRRDELTQKLADLDKQPRA